MTESGSIQSRVENIPSTQNILMQRIGTVDIYKESKIFSENADMGRWEVYDGDIDLDGNHDIAYVRYANDTSGSYISDFKLFAKPYNSISYPVTDSDYSPERMLESLKKKYAQAYCIRDRQLVPHNELDRLVYSNLGNGGLFYTGYINPDYCDQWGSSTVVYKEENPLTLETGYTYMDLSSLSILEMSAVDYPRTIQTLAGILPSITLQLKGTIFDFQHYSGGRDLPNPDETYLTEKE